MHKDVLAEVSGGGSGGGGAQATSYKAAVDNGNNQGGERREIQQTRSQNARGSGKGKGLVHDKQGVPRYEGSYHPYKEMLRRGYGEGSSQHGRDAGYGEGKRDLQARGMQPIGYQNKGNAEGDQQLQDPTKLMLDAFKGVCKSPSSLGPKQAEEGKSGGNSKTRKALLFEEPSLVGNDFGLVDETTGVKDSQLIGKQSEVDVQRNIQSEVDVQKDIQSDEHSQALDDVNMLLDGELLSDSELLGEDGEELEDWEQGEITDGMEVEELGVMELVAEVPEMENQGPLEAGLVESEAAEVEKEAKKKGGKTGGWRNY